jgi:hypothetical protein
VGAALAIVAASLVIYVPYVNSVIFGGGPAPFIALVGPLLAGHVLVVYETLRRVVGARFSKTKKKKVVDIGEDSLDASIAGV